MQNIFGVQIIRNIFFIILLSTYSNLSYSQFPIGKNITTAKIEIKLYLKSKGFNFLRDHKLSENLEGLLYSDEFRVTLRINSFENIQSINFGANKIAVMNKLKKAFYFSDWNYKGEYPNALNEIESIYYYKNYKIRMDMQTLQFVVTIISNE